MRITTNTMIRNYKNNLTNSISSLNAARTRVLTQRSFNSVAEDPFAAYKASRLQRQYQKNQDSIDMVSEAEKLLDSQADSIMEVSDVAKEIAEVYNVKAAQTTYQSESTRQTFVKGLRGFQETMVKSLNANYSDTFLMAGADGDNAPFSLSEDGKLTYRGINVDAAKGTADYERLTELSKENLYVDIGIGLSLDNGGNVDPSSAFDISLPGINVVGYGKDDDGLSNNAIVLAGQLADLMEADTFDADAYGKLMDKFQTVKNNIIDSTTGVGVKSKFLENTKDRLETVEINLAEQLESVEGIDMAEAITDYSWYEYAYNAALKVGTGILSSSFIDFMK